MPDGRLLSWGYRNEYAIYDFAPASPDLIKIVGRGIWPEDRTAFEMRWLRVNQTTSDQMIEWLPNPDPSKGSYARTWHTTRQ